MPAYKHTTTSTVSLRQAYVSIPVNISGIIHTPGATGFSIAFQFRCTPPEPPFIQRMLSIAQWHFVKIDAGEIRLHVQAIGGLTMTVYRYSGNFMDGNWHTMIYSVSSVGSKISFWVDDMLKCDGCADFLPVALLATTANSLRIGTDTGNNIDYKMVSVFDFLITPTQLCTEYCGPDTYLQPDFTGGTCVKSMLIDGSTDAVHLTEGFAPGMHLRTVLNITVNDTWSLGDRVFVYTNGHPSINSIALTYVGKGSDGGGSSWSPVNCAPLLESNSTYLFFLKGAHIHLRVST